MHPRVLGFWVHLSGLGLLYRHLSEGLHPLESLDSAKPLFGTKEASSSSEASGGGEDSQAEPEPLSMALKSGFRQQPPYKAGAAEDADTDAEPEGADKGAEPDQETQPLTRELKGGALASATSAGRSSANGAPLAPRPPISAFWVSCVPRRCLQGRWTPVEHAGRTASSRHTFC